MLRSSIRNEYRDAKNPACGTIQKRRGCHGDERAIGRTAARAHPDTGEDKERRGRQNADRQDELRCVEDRPTQPFRQGVLEVEDGSVAAERAAETSTDEAIRDKGEGAPSRATPVAAKRRRRVPIARSRDSLSTQPQAHRGGSPSRTLRAGRGLGGGRPQPREPSRPRRAARVRSGSRAPARVPGAQAGTTGGRRSRSRSSRCRRTPAGGETASPPPAPILRTRLAQR